MTKKLSVRFWIVYKIVHNFARLTFVYVEMIQIPIIAFQKIPNKDC